MLKGARERAESFDPNSTNISPRLRPLLRTSPTPRGPNDPSGSLSLPEAADDGQGVVTAQPERQQSLNYQGTAQTSPETRRRSAQSRKSNGRESGQAPPRGDDVGEANGLGRRQEEEPVWKKTIRYFKSVELENKGSVARDHLALGAAISAFGCGFEWQDKEADSFLERTFLAWLRTSLAFASIGIAITQLFRLNTSLEGETKRAETLRHLGKPLGATFLAVSILILLLGYNRFLQGQHWVIKGKFPASRGTIMIVSFIAFTVTLASLIVILAVQSDPS